MAEKWFRGSISKRRSQLVVNHLERALGETTSDDEKDVVYANLYEEALKAKPTDEGFVRFYTELPRNSALSISEDREGIPSSSLVRKGHELAKILGEGVSLLPLGHKNYTSKMIKARQIEYRLILDYVEGRKEGD